MAQKKTTANDSESTPRKPAPKGSADVFSFSVFNSPFNGSSDQTMEKLMTQSKNQYDKFAQEAGDIGRENMEAMIKAGSIFMKGFEDIIRTSTALAQSTAEKQAEFVKEALSTKTINEWTEVQNKAAQANFDDFMAGATQISELSVKLITESSEPINAQMTKTIKKASESMAA